VECLNEIAGEMIYRILIGGVEVENGRGISDS
jgi:hypothetical protein